jgi:hypothetical protein
LEESTRFEGFYWVREGDMASWNSDYELRELTLKWTRVPSVGVVQDPAMCTFHFLNVTADVPDASWTTSDYANVEGAATTFWNAIKDKYKAETKLAEFSWRADGPEFKPFGDSLSPTLRVTPVSLPGTHTATEMLPPQCACTVTEVTEAHYTAYGVGVPGKVPGTGRTQVRNRWGRFYLPAPAVQEVGDGRWKNSMYVTVADAVKVFYDTLIDLDLFPVMYSPTTGVAHSIVEIRVDDIVDVIRSRRFITPISRTARDLHDIP